MELIFEALYFHHPIIPGAEITLEANPDDISMPWLEMIAASPVNRLSIGVQSFHNEDLHWLERVHDGHQAAESVALALKAGFANLTVDLIYGIPGLTDSRWRENLDSFFSLKVPHLSAYALTVEEKTPLNQQIRKGLKAEADEEQAARHFRILLQEARKNDFIHYEISNFAKENYIKK